jgi:cytoskeletal protein CcmA (bactofilin family)
MRGVITVAKEEKSKAATDGAKPDEKKPRGDAATLTPDWPSNPPPKSSMFGRMNRAFHDALQNSRGPNREAVAPPSPPAVDDLSVRRQRSAKDYRTLIPEGVVIEGNVSSSVETEVSGRVTGHIQVQGRLYLGSGALVAGNVRAESCTVEGRVEGKTECLHDLELGKSGRLNADVMAGGAINLAGQVFGNIMAGQQLRIQSTARVTGDIRTPRLIIEEGAFLNGACSMKPLEKRSQEKQL